MKNLIKYYLFALTVLSNITVFGQKEMRHTKKSVNRESYCENDVLVVYADSQDKLLNDLKLCENPTSLYLKLSPKTTYQLDDLKKLTSLRILTIEFAVYDENNFLYDGGINSMDLIDCSFLTGMNNLEFLVIDWLGGVINIEALNNLENLVYAKLPLEAFHPLLFSETSNVVEYEFGDSMTFRRNNYLSDLQTPQFDYENYLRLSNGQVKKFLRKAQSINIKGTLKWPNEHLLLSTNSDTMFYMSDRRLDSVAWCFNFSENIGFSKGRYSPTIYSIETYYFSFERYLKFQDGNQYLVQLKTRSDRDVTEYDLEKEVGYRNGAPHGTFSEYLFGQLGYKKIYEDGILLYDCHGINSIPKLGLGYPLDFQIAGRLAHVIELFYEQKDTVLIRLYGGRNGDLLTQKVLELPLKKNNPHGKVILFHPNGDTATVAEYLDGKLHGSYYSHDVSYGDKIIKKAQYRHGILHGDVSRTGGECTFIEKYDNGRLIYALKTRNNNQTKEHELIWNAEQNYAETTFWSEDGKIIRILRQNEDGKAIYSREYPENITHKVINYQP
jgi:antitoxin component YwqK of YwqJK toxin-antitoxin module